MGTRVEKQRNNSRLVSEALDFDDGRYVSALLPPMAADTVVYAADGGWHVRRLGQALEQAGIGSTMVVGVHGLDDDEGRLGEYVPGFDDVRFAAHEHFFVHEAREWTAERLGVVPPAERTAVWGASLGAEFALAMGLRHPDVYQAVFAASPGGGYRPPTIWPDDLPRVYLVAGVGEPFFLDNAERWAAALQSTDTTAVLAKRPGGHGDGFWFEELPAMVTWAFASHAR